MPEMAGWGLLIAYRRSDADNRGLESNSARIESRWGRVMISVEVYQVDDTADEAAAVRALQEAKGRTIITPGSLSAFSTGISGRSRSRSHRRRKRADSSIGCDPVGITVG